MRMMKMSMPVKGVAVQLGQLSPLARDVTVTQDELLHTRGGGWRCVSVQRGVKLGNGVPPVVCCSGAWPVLTELR